MRIFFLIAIFVTTSVFAHAAGGPPDPEAKAAVEKCLAEKEKSNGSPELCVGVYTEACLGKSDALSTSDMMTCNSKETAVWQEHLNRDYQELLKEMKNKDKERLRDMQRAWIAFREKKCGFRQQEQEGTVGVIQNVSCYLEETGRQSFFLQTLLP